MTRLLLVAHKTLVVAGHKRFWEQHEQTGQQKETLKLTLYFLSYMQVTRTEIKIVFVIHPSPWQLAITMTLWESLDFRKYYYNCANSRFLTASVAQVLLLSGEKRENQPPYGNPGYSP